MEYANQAMNSTKLSPAGYDNLQTEPSSELSGIASRIHSTARGMEGLTDSLRSHADRVHGEAPPPATGTGPTPCRSGQLGAIYDALDRELALLAEQAGRNSTLA